MKRFTILLPMLVFVIFPLLTIQGCNEENDITPPPDFYECSVTVGNEKVFLSWHFLGFPNEDYEVEVTYYQDNVKKVQKCFGVNNMTVSGLRNNEKYVFTVVASDLNGNKGNPWYPTAIPNPPFVIVSPTNPNDYSLEDGKVRIDLRFNRPADISCTDSQYISGIIYLMTNSFDAPYSLTWRDEGLVLSILTDETKESFCTNFPCTLTLVIKETWIGGSMYWGIFDTNGMILDGDNDGIEMGRAELTFNLE